MNFNLIITLWLYLPPPTILTLPTRPRHFRFISSHTYFSFVMAYFLHSSHGFLAPSFSSSSRLWLISSPSFLFFFFFSFLNLTIPSVLLIFFTSFSDLLHHFLFYYFFSHFGSIPEFQIRKQISSQTLLFPIINFFILNSYYRFPSKFHLPI